MRFQKRWSNRIFVLFIFVLLSCATYSQASNVYKNNFLYEGGKLMVTWRNSVDGMVVSQFYWVDGKQTINGVSCWRVFHSYEGYNVTGDEYGIGYYAMIDNEYRLYMQEYLADGTYGKIIFTPYMIEWKYGVEPGETWSHDYTMSVESTYDMEEWLIMVFGEEYVNSLSQEEKQALIDKFKPAPRQITETFTLLEYEDTTTYFGSHSSALKFEKKHIEDLDYNSYTEYGWMDFSVGNNIKGIDQTTGAETHITYDYESSGAAPGKEKCQITGLEITGIPSPGDQVSLKINTQSNGDGINYRYSIRGGYGSSAYESADWQLMGVSEYQSQSSLDYSFGNFEKSIVVAWATSLATDGIDPTGIPIIGWSVDTSGGCAINFTGLSITGEQKINQKMTFGVNAVNPCGTQLYYRFSMHAGYGTSQYDGTQWTKMTTTEWVNSSSINYTFSEVGKYIIVVWVTDDINNYEISSVPIIGWSVDIGAV